MKLSYIVFSAIFVSGMAFSQEGSPGRSLAVEKVGKKAMTKHEMDHHHAQSVKVIANKVTDLEKSEFKSKCGEGQKCGQNLQSFCSGKLEKHKSAGFLKGPEEEFMKSCLAQVNNKGKKLKKHKKKLSKKDEQFWMAMKVICEQKINDNSKHKNKPNDKLATDKSEEKVMLKQIMSCISQIKKIDVNLNQDSSVKTALVKNDDSKPNMVNNEKSHQNNCSFHEGVSIDCPEGTYTFSGHKGLSKISEDARHIVKEIPSHSEGPKQDTASVSQK